MGNKAQFKYSAIRFQVKKLGKRCRVEKPLDFYNFRHSCAALMKKENWPVDIAAKKLGHSVKHYTDTYGRLTVEDDVQRLREHRGLRVEEPTFQNNITCSRCQFVNEPGLELCSQCGSPLTLQKALEGDNTAKLSERLNELEASLQMSNEIMKEWFARDPQTKMEFQARWKKLHAEAPLKALD